MKETFEKQLASAKKAFVDYAIAGIIMLLFCVIAALIPKGDNIFVWILIILILGGIIIYFVYITITYFVMYSACKKIQSLQLEEKSFKCRNVKFRGVAEGKYNSQMVAVIFEANKEKYIYILPKRDAFTSSVKRKYKEKYLNKTVNIRCYEGTKFVNSIEE